MKIELRIAVCIPTFNRKHQLGHAVQSLLKQSDSDFDIYVFDDCSTDGTFEYIKDIQLHNPNVFYHLNEQNVGYVGNVNRCLELYTNYDWIGILHNDDFYSENAITEVKKYLLKFPQAGIIYSDCHIINEHGKIKKTTSRKLKVYNKGDEAILASLSFIPCSTTFYGSHAIRQTGFFKQNFPFSADEEYNSRLAENYSLIKIPFPIATVHLHGHNYRYETWKQSGFIQNYQQMRQLMLKDVSLESGTRNKLISEHMAKTCVHIFKELRKKGYKKEAKTYQEFLRNYEMPFILKVPYILKLYCFRVILN